MTDDLPDTMNALRAHRRGGPDVLVYEQAPRPVPSAGEVLVRVHAAAITFTELDWDLSWTSVDGADRTPVIPSHEFSGVVAVGPTASNGGVQAGDEVYGLAPFDRNGAAAEYVVAPEELVAVKPRRCSHVQAAALPLAASTAWQALVRHAGVRSGERVLVLGGAGGVGAFAVQIAIAVGARVIATVLPGQADIVRRFGAEQVVEGSSPEIIFPDGSFDVVLDTVGGPVQERLLPLLAPGGRIVTLRTPIDEGRAAEHGVRAIFFVVAPDAETYAAIDDLVDAGTLAVTIAATYPLSRGREAYESGGSALPGKTVLLVGVGRAR